MEHRISKTEFDRNSGHRSKVWRPWVTFVIESLILTMICHHWFFKLYTESCTQQMFESMGLCKNCCHLLNYTRITGWETLLSPNNTKSSAFSKYFKICGFVFNCAVTVLAHELWVITCDYHLPTWSYAHLWCLQEQTLLAGICHILHFRDCFPDNSTVPFIHELCTTLDLCSV